MIPFLEGIGPTEKQNLCGLVENHICATIALNRTISSKELSNYKWYQNLISSQKCTSKDAGLLKGMDCGVPHRLERGRLKSIYVRL